MSNDEIIDQRTEAEKAYQDLLVTASANFRRTAETINSIAQRRRRIPEPYFFVKMFPVLRDIVRNIPNPQIPEYLNVMDGVNNEAVVYDDETGEDLFVVPPFMATSRPVVINRDGGKRTPTPNDLVELQQVHRSNNNPRAMMEIESQLSNLFDADHVFSNFERVDQLIDIYLRYDVSIEELFGDKTEEILAGYNGRKGIESTPTEVDNAPTEQKAVTQDDFEY